MAPCCDSKPIMNQSDHKIESSWLMSHAHACKYSGEQSALLHYLYLKLSNKMTTRTFFTIKCRGNYLNFLLLTAAHHNQQIATVLQSIIWRQQSAESWQLLQWAGTNRTMQITSVLLYTSVSSYLLFCSGSGGKANWSKNNNFSLKLDLFVEF